MVGERTDDKLFREEGVTKVVWLEEKEAVDDETGVGEDKADAETAGELEDDSVLVLHGESVWILQELADWESVPDVDSVAADPD